MKPNHRSPTDVPVMDKGKRPISGTMAAGFTPLAKSTSLHRTDRDRLPGKPVPSSFYGDPPPNRSALAMKNGTYEGPKLDD